MKNSPLKSKVDFKATQQAFTNYIRNPHRHPIPEGVPLQRMAMYRELFFNNVESFLSNGFPVLHKILTSVQWTDLVQDFFAYHQSQTPYFSEIAEEFLAYLQNERQNPQDYPFLLELAHYEWVEMALSISQEQLLPFTEYIENFSQQTISLSPLAWNLAYSYAVQKICPRFLPRQPDAEPTYLLVYRDWEDEVCFIETTAITFRLLQIIDQQSAITVEKAVQQVALEAGQKESTAFMEAGLQSLQELSKKSIILLL